jgi:hypothetical protein
MRDNATELTLEEFFDLGDDEKLSSELMENFDFEHIKFVFEKTKLILTGSSSAPTLKIIGLPEELEAEIYNKEWQSEICMAFGELFSQKPIDKFEVSIAYVNQEDLSKSLMLMFHGAMLKDGSMIHSLEPVEMMSFAGSFNASLLMGSLTRPPIMIEAMMENDKDLFKSACNKMKEVPSYVTVGMETEWLLVTGDKYLKI